MNKIGLWAASLAVAGLAFAQPLPSSAASRWHDPYYGLRYWWAHQQHPGKIHVYKSRYARGCGYYNCYSGKFGYRNRIPVTSSIFPYRYPGPNAPPEIGFGIVVY